MTEQARDCGEYMIPLPEIKKPTNETHKYTPNNVQSKSVNTISSKMFKITTVIIFSFLVGCMIFLVNSSVVLHGKLDITDKPTKVDYNRDVCVEAYRRQMKLVDSWQANGTEQFFNHCKYQYKIGGGNYISVCNTSSPSSAIYDFRFYVQGDNDLFPTIRGLSFTREQANTIYDILKSLLF